MKLYEEFNEMNEFNLNLFGAFKKFLKNAKKDKDDDFIDDIEIINPETKKPIKLSSALSYDKKSKVKQLADKAMAELRDNIKDSKAVGPEQKVSYQFNKQLKKRKADAKKWGEDWTERDGGKTIFYRGKKVDRMNPEPEDFEDYITTSVIGNRSCLFKNVEDGWHGVTQVNSIVHRQICNVVILK